MACASYVELNPVRASMVKNPKDYKWSSYNVYAFGKKSNMVDVHASYKNLGKDETESREKYVEFVKRMLKERDGMRGEMDEKTIYGGKKFSEYIKNTCK